MVNTFEKLLAELSRAGVDFIVVGGMAVAYCGHLRNTVDLDILVRAASGNIERLLACLEGFGEGHARELSPNDFALEEGAVRIVEDFPLDVFTQMSGRTYEDLLPLSTTREVSGTPVRHLIAEGLILLKKDSLRPRDQHDVQVLRDLQQDDS